MSHDHAVPRRLPAASRRTVLLAAALGGLGACSPSPVVRGPHGGEASGAQTAEATMTTVQQQLWQAEQDLGELVSRHSSLSPAWTRAVAAQCEAHVARLGHVDPLDEHSPVPEAPKPSPEAAGAPAKDLAALQTLLQPQLDALVAGHKAAALAATDGSLALLHTSLALAAANVRTPEVPPVAGEVAPAHIEVGGRADALAVLLSRLRALVFGMQVGIGQLPLPSELYSPARRRMTAVLAQRDLVMQTMTDEKVAIAPPELSYALPGKLDDAAAITRTWGLLERGVLDAWARLAAASTGAGRSVALDAALAQVPQVRARGIALSHWPGWV